MKIRFSIKAEDIQSASIVEFTMDSSLYQEVKGKIHSFSDELIALNDDHLSKLAAYITNKENV